MTRPTRVTRHQAYHPHGARRVRSAGQVLPKMGTHVTGDPDPVFISTSDAERQNLTIRMAMRRFTPLTNDFRKLVEHLQHAVALHFLYDNFARIPHTLWVTPAMEAGISRHVWTREETVDLVP